MKSVLFTPGSLGPVTLRNRSVRSAAFEGMAPGHLVSDDLIGYHRAVVAGGVGMTTVAYAAISQSGLSFAHDKIEEVLDRGFEFIQIGRALINDPAFINKLRSEEITRSGCKHSNYCITVMYSGKMQCFQHEENLPERWRKSLSTCVGLLLL